MPDLRIRSSPSFTTPIRSPSPWLVWLAEFVDDDTARDSQVVLLRSAREWMNEVRRTAKEQMLHEWNRILRPAAGDHRGIRGRGLELGRKKRQRLAGGCIHGQDAARGAAEGTRDHPQLTSFPYIELGSSSDGVDDRREVRHLRGARWDIPQQLEIAGEVDILSRIHTADVKNRGPAVLHVFLEFAVPAGHAELVIDVHCLAVSIGDGIGGVLDRAVIGIGVLVSDVGFP